MARHFTTLARSAVGFAVLTVAAGFLGGRAHAAPASVRVPAPVQTPTPMTALSVLRKARSTFHEAERPRYVAYTMLREEWLDEFYQPDGSYALRIWYRTSDTGALSRHVDHGIAGGKMDYIHPRFDAPLDPGPPTADIFEPARTVAQIAAPTPAPGATELQTIGSVRVQVENDYNSKIVEADDRQYDIELTPRRDPDRNRLREMWVDRKTYRVIRFTAADKLFYQHQNVIVPLLLDVRMGVFNGTPVITSIHAEPSADDPITIGKTIINIKFTNVAFPGALPDWYFDPRDYRSHLAESPPG